MPFDPKSAKKAGKKSKRGPAKKQKPSIKEKMELLYEKVLDDLLANQDKLTKTERVKLFVTLAGHLVPKNKPTKEIISEQPLFDLTEIIDTTTENDKTTK